MIGVLALKSCPTPPLMYPGSKGNPVALPTEIGSSSAQWLSAGSLLRIFGGGPSFPRTFAQKSISSGDSRDLTSEGVLQLPSSTALAASFRLVHSIFWMLAYCLRRSSLGFPGGCVTVGLCCLLCHNVGKICATSSSTALAPSEMDILFSSRLRVMARRRSACKGGSRRSRRMILD